MMNKHFVDNWYKVEQIDSTTFVIHEPRYWQKNNQYLIIGSEVALLFDSGSGKRKIAPLIEKLTNKPVILFNSHAHYDHIGNNNEFSHIAMTNLAINKQQTKGDFFSPRWSIRLAPKRYSFRISHWYEIHDSIDLGDRKLTILPLPGHSKDHVGLMDEKNGYMFVADTLYHAPLIANLPTANIVDYYTSAKLLDDIYENHQIFGNHYAHYPSIGRQEIHDLITVCEQATGYSRRWKDYVTPIITFSYGTIKMYVSHSSLNKVDQARKKQSH